MDRRSFFKIISTASGGALTGACGKKAERYIPLLVSEQELVPGEETWHPGLCAECEASCGVIVRVMEGERIIERHGEQFRTSIAAIKKIEGNPLDSVSGGRLCARGHAALQSLYHPDRLQGPMRREGARGQGNFAPTSWDQALADIAAKLDQVRHDPEGILFLARPRAGTRALTIDRFLRAIGASPAISFEIADFPLERQAAQIAYGWGDLPFYDLANATYAVGIGADFLGGWTSPVFYARQFGHFRQGRANVRGKLVQAESRFSITAQSADEWLPLNPGTELFFALALGHLLLTDDMARTKSVPAQALEAFQVADPGAAARLCGTTERRIRQVARELAEAERPLLVAGASVPQTNSLAALVAAGYLNILLGNVGSSGGVKPPAPDPSASRPAYGNALARLEHAKFVFLDGVDPLYTLPVSAGAAGMLARCEMVVSFSPFLNDSTASADLILPDHHSLESTAAVFTTVAPALRAVLATPFVQPLHDTRATELVLAELARKMNLEFEPATPRSVVEKLLPPALSWDEVVRQGGFWGASNDAGLPSSPGQLPTALEATPATFYGDAAQFPFYFLPYYSLQFHDGRSANLPWMQELPDPVSSAMWGLPVEIDRQTASRLEIRTGDRVKVESPYGELVAPAYVDPAAVPGVVSMGIGQGHRHFGRYASRRGANPLSILAPAWEKSTGALAVGATRVRLTRVGTGNELIQFAAVDRELGPWGNR